MTISRQLLTTVLILLSLPVSAEVYRQIDRDGNVTYTDHPGDGAEPIKVEPVATIKFPAQKDLKFLENNAANKQPKEAASTGYKAVSFVAPNDKQAFWSGNGDIEFQVSSNPALKPQNQYEIALDGQTVAKSNSSTATVRNVDRGTHTAQVNVIDSKGNRVATGDSIEFTIHRPSVRN